MANTESIGDRLRRLREAAGFTQAELADAAGVARPSVNEIETGVTAKPRRATLSKLAAKLGVSVDMLQGSDGRALSPAPVAAAVAPAAPAPAASHGTQLVETARALAENEFLKQTIQQLNDQVASQQAMLERLLDLVAPGKLYPDSYAAEAPAMYTTTPTRPVGFQTGKQEEPEAFALMSVDGRLYGGLHGGLLSVVGTSVEEAA